MLGNLLIRALSTGLVAAVVLSACGDGARIPASDGAATTDVAPMDTAETADAPDEGADDSAGDVPDDLGPVDADDTPGTPDVTDAGEDPDAESELPDATSDTEGDGDAAETVDGDVLACPPGEACSLPFLPFCQQGRCNAKGVCAASPIAGCCLSQADCADAVPNGPCETVRCVANSCTSLPRPGCCTGDADCQDAVACSADSCSSAGVCVHCPVGCTCPAQPYTFSLGFEGQTSFGQLNMLPVDWQFGDGVAWQLDTHRAVRGERSVYLGNPTCRTYYNGPLGPDCQPASGNGTQVRAELYGPIMNLASTSPGHVGLVWVWADVEPPSPAAPDADVLRVTLQDLSTGLDWPLVSTLPFGKSTWGAWRLLAFDLSAFRGVPVRVRFGFDTIDGQDNHHEGVYLDDFAVVDRCHGGCCLTDGDCAGLPLPDACSAARCVPLDDGAGNVCVVVPASPGESCEPCLDAAACADGNPCTVDTCDAGACVHTPFCCFAATLSDEGFEDGLAGWYAEGDPDGARWSAVPDAFEGSLAAGFVDPETGTYGPGPSAGTLSSGPVVLPEPLAGGGQLELAFRLRLETEWDGLGYDNPLGLDRLTLEVVSGGQATEVWSSDDVGGTTSGAWELVTVPLDPWAGEGITLRFRFETVDDAGNAFAGPRIDALTVRRACD